MLRPGSRRLRIQLAIAMARRQASKHRPLSPDWDAAIGRVEDLERERWHLDHPGSPPSAPSPGAEASQA